MFNAAAEFAEIEKKLSKTDKTVNSDILKTIIQQYKTQASSINGKLDEFFS